MATFYYAPGFNKPNGTGECIVSLKAWDALDSELKAIVQHACAGEATFALAEMERLNAEALAALTGQHGVKLRTFPAESDRGGAPAGDRRARRACRPRARSARKVHNSYLAFRDRTAAWSRISIKAVLEARDG